MKQHIFLGDELDPRINRITMWDGQHWYRWKDDWVRESWCGKFPDNTTRPPWHDEQFFRLWNTEGPEAARDKSRYNLSVVTHV